MYKKRILQFLNTFIIVCLSVFVQTGLLKKFFSGNEVLLQFEILNIDTVYPAKKNTCNPFLYAREIWRIVLC